MFEFKDEFYESVMEGFNKKVETILHSSEKEDAMDLFQEGVAEPEF